MIDEHIQKLGFKATDKVTGTKGVITSVVFDLYGCVQAALTPPIKEDGTRPDTRWYDIPRLKITGKKPVMAAPDFEKGYVAEGKKGPAEKMPLE